MKDQWDAHDPQMQSTLAGVLRDAIMPTQNLGSEIRDINFSKKNYIFWHQAVQGGARDCFRLSYGQLYTLGPLIWNGASSLGGTYCFLG